MNPKTSLLNARSINQGNQKQNKDINTSNDASSVWQPASEVKYNVI